MKHHISWLTSKSYSMTELSNPLASKPTVYHSASKGSIPISEMEKHHLNNAILKLQREKEAGQSVPEDVLAALIAEQTRRQPPASSTPPAVETAPATPATEITPTPQPVNIGVLAAGLAAVTQGLTEGKIQQQLPTDKLAKLAAALDELIASSSLNQAAADKVTYGGVESVELKDANLPLAQLLNLHYPQLTSPLLLKSLHRYGIVTVNDLAGIAACDFGAVRFSTAGAFIEASRLLADYGLNWCTESRILVHDGAINRVLNPNASAIDVFVKETTRRLNATRRTYDAAAVDRIFSGIKRRIALAVSVLGTSLLARGHNVDTAAPLLAGLPAVSDSFRKQVKLYISRMSARALAIWYAETYAPAPASTRACAVPREIVDSVA